MRIKLGDLAVPVQFVGLVDHFPTLYLERGTFLVVDLSDYRNYVLGLPFGRLDRPGEMWLSLDQSADRQQVVAQIPDLLPGFMSIRDRELDTEMADKGADVVTRQAVGENEMRQIMSDHQGFADVLRELGESGLIKERRLYGDY